MIHALYGGSRDTSESMLGKHWGSNLVGDISLLWYRGRLVARTVRQHGAFCVRGGSANIRRPKSLKCHA